MGWVVDALCLLALSRKGLSEEEILVSLRVAGYHSDVAGGDATAPGRQALASASSMKMSPSDIFPDARSFKIDLRNPSADERGRLMNRETSASGCIRPVALSRVALHLACAPRRENSREPGMKPIALPMK